MSGGGDEDRVRREFVAEAQEIIEAVSRDLLVLDENERKGVIDPDLVNSIFRGVHTLKGIAGMFGFGDLGRVSHVLEDLLDDVRLGRHRMSANTLDVLFEGVEGLQRLLAANEDGSGAFDVMGYESRVLTLRGPASADGPKDLAAFGIEEGVVSVLTEYEEHRLRTNIDQRVPLYRLRLRFGLTTIDSDLEGLKSKAKPHGEVITYLPSMGSGDEDTIDLEVILASNTPPGVLREALCDDPEAVIQRLDDRRTMLPATPVSSIPAPSPATAQSTYGQPPPPAVEPSVKAVTKTVRVDIAKLDHLMNVVGELNLLRSSLGPVVDTLRSELASRRVGATLHRISRQLERQLEVLQDGILDVRMVPLGQSFDRLARAVRQVARDHGKEVRLLVTGADTEVDKLIVEELADPLLHITRNAIDHGIERADERADVGKPEVGTLALNAYQKGNHVVIEIEDDGAGMDDGKILAAAVERGAIIPAANEMSRSERLALVFLPGVSTRSEVSELSGRGVGMDVVKTHISRLGGVVDVQSELGVGSKFTITLPITLAIISALVIRSRQETFAIPLTVVQEALILPPGPRRKVDGQEVITLRGATLPICRLAELFRLPRNEERVRTGKEKEYVVVTSLGHRRLGLVVDALEGQQDIIIKPLGASLRTVQGFAGATDLGDQRVVLVLDVNAILAEVLSGPERRSRAEATP